MDFHLIYYKEEIVKWLDECENAQNLKETIKQYKSLISQIYGEKICKSKKIITQYSKIAREIADNYDDVYIAEIDNFLFNVYEILEQKVCDLGFEISDFSSHQKRKYHRRFEIYKKGWKFAFALECGDTKCRDFYYEKDQEIKI